MQLDVTIEGRGAALGLPRASPSDGSDLSGAF